MTVREEIEKLKKEKNAVILAHYYVSPEVQELADYVGDSFYLSKIAVGLEEQTIVFCGVSFMGESTKVLNPEKTVLMPDAAADCAMAHMADVETIEKMRRKYEDLAVVCYINSTAELKSHSDVCVTSANAVRIVKALPNKNIFFIPDRNLAHYIALTHPECPAEVLEISDYIGSTSGIISYAGKSEAEEFIICTENGVRYELEKQYPDKKFWFTDTEPVCTDMKMITPEKILHVLKTGENEVKMEDALRKTAEYPLERMLELAK